MKESRAVSCYVHLTGKKSEDHVLEMFGEHGFSSSSVIIDAENPQKKEGSLYANLKKHLAENKNILIIDSLDSLGKNGREIFKELSWFSDHCVDVCILDMPSTLSESVHPMSVLLDVYRKISANEISNVKREQRAGIQKAQGEYRHYGRQKIPFPENWEENYALWNSKDITAGEFLKRTGLKKGTFYNLIKQYKAQHIDTETKEA